MKAVTNVNEIIVPEIIGFEVSDQRGIDLRMIELDGTKIKQN